MKIRELFDLISVISPIVDNRDFQVVDGCEVLEHISDIPGFVELLRGFKRGDVNFVSDHPDPIEFILDEGVVFSLHAPNSSDGVYWCCVSSDVNCYFFDNKSGNIFYELIKR